MLFVNSLIYKIYFDNNVCKNLSFMPNNILLANSFTLSLNKLLKNFVFNEFI